MTFYADASSATGYGHLYRSLLVARMYKMRHGGGIRAVMKGGHDATLLQEAGVVATFVDGDLVGRVCATAKPEDGPILLDSYCVTSDHLHTLKSKGYRVALFDDGMRLSIYDADVVIDSAPGAEALPYAGAEHTQFLLGANYFPLRDEFRNIPLQVGDKGTPTVVVTFGASDPDDVTAMAVRALGQTSGVRLIVVLGPGYRGGVSEGDISESHSVARNVKNMAKVFADASVVLCGGGGTALEAAAMGKAVAIIILSPDQRPIADCLDQVGAAQIVGDFNAVEDNNISNAVMSLIENPQRRCAMSVVGRQMIDGHGAERIADTLWGI
ncbi:PseG/SpsG family protein [Pseudomonadota bacterium]